MKIKRIAFLPRNMPQVRSARVVIGEIVQGMECEIECQHARAEMVQSLQIGKAINQLSVFPGYRNDDI